ncbi:hypothetical protein GDO81_011870 [Engystomops pustulosus]|uniref:Uncharacterized protein n=1 Tax=Engystomops pustulosus TaxID=76066 RepID=A0AAV7BHM2_ENGPU|nr:hypothetical protein GDO81_011870 [Engystomops pustulosus]
MILAEKGGVCKMVGVACRIYIPDDIAPYRSITHALEEIEGLAQSYVLFSLYTAYTTLYCPRQTNYLQIMIMTKTQKHRNASIF